MITKLGAEMAAQPMLGLPASEGPQSPTRSWFSRMKSGIGRSINPLVSGGIIGASVASGEQSLGEAVGDVAGGMAGWNAGSAVAKRYIPNVGFWGKAANIGIGMIGSLVGSSAGNTVLGAALPFKRPPQTPDTYLPGNNTQ